jgi:hypothetical protein
MAASIGYSLGVTMMLWIGVSPGFITWMTGITLGIILIIITFRFNLQQFVIVLGTSIIGSATIIGTLLMGVENLSLMRLADNPIRTMLQGSLVWGILYILLAASGIFVQMMKEQTTEF